jgi:dienelactone hydrolase
MAQGVAVRRFVALGIAAAALLISGFTLGRSRSFNQHVVGLEKRLASGTAFSWDDPDAGSWPSDFQAVQIGSQPAYVRQAQGPQPRPLVISLHTWSGSYRQSDPVADFAKSENWNYIHPDIEGRNDHAAACLSDKVVSDLDDAVAYALKNWHVDANNIIVNGVSGGGYATLGAYLRMKHPVKAFIAWVPISDLSAWYRQSVNRGNSYARLIAACTSREGRPDVNAMRARSPLYWPVRPSNARLDIFAGGDDGYSGSVPISQSINFFDKLAGAQAVPESDLSRLLSRDFDPPREKIGDRDVYYRRDAGNVHLVIFQGAHEMLPEHDRRQILADVAAN